MNIAFHINQFSYRGTEVATFDYAMLNKYRLKNNSIIVHPENPVKTETYDKFKKHFSMYEYSSTEDLKRYLKEESIDAIYFIVYGIRNGITTEDFGIPSFVHCVFTCHEPHGSVYAGVSQSVAHVTPDIPFVPHLIHLPDINTDYREKLGIPKNAIVFGRHGGEDTFNIDFVKDAILKILEERQDIYFLFAIRPKLLDEVNHPRILYFPSFVDKRVKTKFINTCDAMIHACNLGESFGISILEFSYRNKPVITWNNGIWHTQHLDNLGEKAILYKDEEELLDIFRKFNPDNYKMDYKYLCEPFNEENIANKFKSVFLDTLTSKMND